MAAPSQDGKEFIVRACGKKDMERYYMLSKFPRGWPEWQGNSFTASREVDPTIPKRKMSTQYVRQQPMVVQGEHPSSSDGRVPGYRGTVDSTASGSAGFFLLIKEGNSFVAVPMDTWMTFRPAIRHKAMSLEEAERFMMEKRTATGNLEASHPRLATKTAEAMGDAGVAPSVHALVKHLAREEGPGAAQQQQRKGGGVDVLFDDEKPEEEEGEVDPVKQEKAEDWEHEQQAQDDDLDMGDEVQEEAPVQQEDSEDARRRARAQGPEEGGPGEEVQGELERILKKHHTTSNEYDDYDDDEDGWGDEEEEEEEDDVDDLDNMASKLQVRGSQVLSKRDPTPPVRGTGGAGVNKSGDARGRTPPVGAAGGSVAGGGKRKITDAPTDTAKRPRTSRSPSPAVFAAAAAGSGNSSAAGGGLHSRMEAAVRSLVGSAPPHSVTMKDVTAMMKTKFVNEAWQEPIKSILKKVVKLETDKEGNKWLGLR